MNLEALQKQFETNFEERNELGASVSIWKDGAELVSLHRGWMDKAKTRPWNEHTLVPIWSATKGPAAVAVLSALAESGVRVTGKVAKLWPELPAAANSSLTFADILSHQSGLSALSRDNRGSILSHSSVRTAMEAQEPFWEPGKAHGYHPRTLGYLYDEIVRRLTDGISLGTYWNNSIAKKWGLDLWIGNLPLAALDRLATMAPPTIQKPPETEMAFYRALANAESLSLAAFSSPAGMRALSDINKLEYLQAGLPALGGVATGRSLAKFYQILAQGGTFDGVQLLSQTVMHSIRALQTSGDDLTLLIPTAFTCGFMKDPLNPEGEKIRQLFGPSKEAFGQPGAGGSHAFADPESGYSFAYVMNQMEAGILPNEKSLDLVALLYEK